MHCTFVYNMKMMNGNATRISIKIKNFMLKNDEQILTQPTTKIIFMNMKNVCILVEQWQRRRFAAIVNRARFIYIFNGVCEMLNTEH